MLIDQNAIFSSSQNVAAAANSTNIIDLRGTYARPGVGARSLYIALQATSTFEDSSNNSSLTVYLQTDAAANMASATNAQTLTTFATNTANGTIVIVPITSSAAEQYAMLRYEPSGGDFNTANVTAWVVADPQLWSAEPVSYSGPATA